ncbi:hypothetical protein ABW19_dt0208976 [Dactylella cylindrospora]|nr:hypothetical protein ABW19_dt0208976 [Dactylella cylindrospora]
MAELQVDVDSVPIANATLVNSTDASITLEKDEVSKSDNAIPPPTSVEPGESKEFTLSPGDELKYKIGDLEFKIKYELDKDAPKLKLSDELEADDTPFGLETTKVETETETETEVKTETTKSRTTGPKKPEAKKSDVVKSEVEIGNLKVETKTETKVKTEDRETKTTVTKKTESEKKEVTLVWEFYKA